MKTMRFVLGLWAIGLCAAGAVETARVTANRVNLRAQPASTSEVVGQVSEGDVLTVKSVREDWIEVEAPAAVDVYAHRDFVQAGVVTAQPLNLRAGPGINYSRIGALDRGTRVEVRGEFGEWLKLAPTPGVSLWISPELVRLSVPEPVTPPPAPPAPEPAPPPLVRTPEPMVLPPPVARGGRPPAPQAPPAHPVGPMLESGAILPADLKLAPVARQGALVQREGRIYVPTFTLGRPSPFQFLAGPLNDGQLIAYLRGNNAQLAQLERHPIRIQGREYWVQGSRHPVIVVEQIMLLAE